MNRCLAMIARPPKGGERCTRSVVDGRLCASHVRDGALIPDEWTPTGLPVFYVRSAESRAREPEAVTPLKERDQSVV